MIIVVATTSLSVIYNTIAAQLILNLIALVLLISFQPSPKKMKRLGHRLKMVLRLILPLLIIQIIFRQEGETLWQWSFIRISEDGLNYGIAASLRFLLIILIAGLLFDVPFKEYLLALNAWKFPYEISFLVASVIHFIPIFNRQFQRSREALFMRGIRLSKLPLIKRSKAFISLIFPVVARAVSEVRYRAISLELRAFRLYPERTYLHQQKLKWWDWVVQMAVVFIVILILIYPMFVKYF